MGTFWLLFARNHGNIALPTSSYLPVRIFFRLGFVFDLSRSGKIFSLFPSYVETVFLCTPYFWKTSLLLMWFFKSFNVLHFSLTVLIYRCLYDDIIEKIQLDKTLNQTDNVLFNFVQYQSNFQPWTTFEFSFWRIFEMKK